MSKTILKSRKSSVWIWIFLQAHVQIEVLLSRDSYHCIQSAALCFYGEQSESAAARFGIFLITLLSTPSVRRICKKVCLCNPAPSTFVVLGDTHTHTHIFISITITQEPFTSMCPAYSSAFNGPTYWRAALCIYEFKKINKQIYK